MKQSIVYTISSIGNFIIFILKILKIAIFDFPRWILLREQLFQVGVLSLPVVAMTGFATGLVLATQSFYQLSDKGLNGITGLMVAKAMVTELGPVLTAFMITGRIGAAMCAEIGSMKVTEQIDALRSMSVDPLRYLVAPRMIAGVSMSPLLTIFSNAMGVWGGYLISIYLFGMTPNAYLDPIVNYLTPFDFITGIIKSFVFGCLIVAICCYKGMKTHGGAAGVGTTTTNSVVFCYTLILLNNFLLTLALSYMRAYFSPKLL